MLKSGEKIKAKVTSVVSYGAFCDIMDYEGEFKGLIHISEFSDYFVSDVNDFVKVGDEIEVEVLSYDESKKQVKLSFKSIRPDLLKSADKAKLQENGSGFKGLKDKIDEQIDESK